MVDVLTRDRRLTTRQNPADFSSSVHRYRDSKFGLTAVKVFPGEHYVTDADEMLVTVLGSCVAACIRDPVAAVGGMNHFMLPESGSRINGDRTGGEPDRNDRDRNDPGRNDPDRNEWSRNEWDRNEWAEPSSAMRYGNVAMEQLINDILAHGGRRQRLEIKVFGGGNVMKGFSDIGHRNATFVETYLAAESLPIAGADLRGRHARRVHYFPATGRVMLLELRRAEEDVSVADLETRYQAKLQSDPVSGSIELF
jgi:chemotaxis protein CheD